MTTHLFFDLDHTLWDFEANKNAVLAALWQEEGFAEEELFREFQSAFDRHNEHYWARFRKGEITRGDLRWKRFAQALLDLRQPDEARALRMSERFLELLPEQHLLLPYAAEVLAHCAQKGYPMAIVTNGFDATQRRKIARAGIDGYFSGVYSSENCGRPKPHPEIFMQAQKGSGARMPENCLLVGDSIEADIAGARNAGWKQVFYNPARVPHPEKPTHEIGCLSELIGIL